jgi:hypothetical protein
VLTTLDQVGGKIESALLIALPDADADIPAKLRLGRCRMPA